MSATNAWVASVVLTELRIAEKALTERTENVKTVRWLLCSFNRSRSRLCPWV